MKRMMWEKVIVVFASKYNRMGFMFSKHLDIFQTPPCLQSAAMSS